jgi:hypothetical protein
MDPYGTNTIYNSNQMLKVAEENETKFAPEIVIKAFIKFIKEYQLNNTYIYRYIIINVLESSLKQTR